LEIEETERDWDKDKLAAIELKSRQDDLFQESPAYFQVTKKLPYNFRYIFTDEANAKRKLMITDWEIGALYWNELKRKHGDEKAALNSVKEKYLKGLIEDRNIHFFVGTTYEWDNRNAPTPFTIIGVYSPPKIMQESLF
jgi:hypothetical protein